MAVLAKLYRVEDAASLLGLQPSTLRKMIFERRITVVRPTARAVRIPETELARIQREGLSPRREEVRPYRAI
jgi:excisionase family DNA binding protein